MTTLNAKANAAYNALIEQVERDNPGDVWAGFEHERDAYEQGWEDGHEARPVVDREAVHSLIGAASPDLAAYPDRLDYVTDAVLALLNGAKS